MNLKHLAGCCMARNGIIQSQPNETQCKRAENQAEVVVSGDSLNALEDESFKSLLPQITAAVIVMSYHIVIGISYGYSAILIPQLLDEQKSAQSANSTSTSIDVTESNIAWIASVLPTSVLPASFIAGMLIDSWGRLNTIKVSAIPNAIGWILIATATNVPMLIIGRILTGAVVAFGSVPAVVYITETSSPSIRGALTSLSPTALSLGMMLAYLEGWFFSWRVVAWTCLVYIIVPIGFITLWLPESPPWLVSKNKIEEAKKSLDWINRYKASNHGILNYSEIQLSLLLKDHSIKQERFDNNKTSVLESLKMLSAPNVLKPFLFLFILFIFQQFSGIFIILFYTVSFFSAVGTEISADLAAVIVGGFRFGMSIVTVFLLKRFNKRSLIMISGIGMAVTIGLSGLFTNLINEGKTTLNWIPVAMILLYVMFSSIGFLGIPGIIIGELFPTAVRGIAHSLSMGTTNLIMFASVQLYFTLTRMFGGVAGLQYFFAVVTIFGVMYNYVFLPETHNKSLLDIQEHFENNWTYIFAKQVKTNENKCQERFTGVDT